MRPYRCLLPIAIILAQLATSCSATMVGPSELKCSVCGTMNTYQEWVSYGSYVYERPSKYQFVFFPLTDSETTFYNCKTCHLSCYTWDVKKIKPSQVADVKRAIRAVPYDAGRAKSMAQRLAIAERVYRVLRKDKDDEFWGTFYRIAGYHLGAEGARAKATEARKKALAITKRMLDQKPNAGIRKELLLISGAMRHYLGDDKGALKDFEKAQKLSYKDPKSSAADNKAKNAYLTKLLKDYSQRIRSAKGPAKDESAK